MHAGPVAEHDFFLPGRAALDMGSADTTRQYRALKCGPWLGRIFTAQLVVDLCAATFEVGNELVASRG
jgi:hypothetical protein